MWKTLLEVRENVSSRQERISQEELEVIVANTIAVMTALPEESDWWREVVADALKKAQSINLLQEVEFFTTVLAILDRQVPSLPEANPYIAELAAIEEGIAQGKVQGDDLPFDAELIRRSVAASLGSPREKMTYMQYLAAMEGGTRDEGLKALIHELQMALVGSELSQLGRNLSGVYRQTWETITAVVEASGIDPRMLDAIVSNTLAVLGPASGRRSEWRRSLVEVRNQATLQGDRNMVGLVNAVIGLLDAGGKTGNASRLGGDLKGVYAQTWQRIVRQLAG